MKLENAAPSTFSECLNTKFRLHQESSTTELELIEVTDGSTPKQVRFAVLFRGPQEPFLVQKIYNVEHDQLGAFDLFIVPIKRDEDGLYYEAVFNRLVKTKNEVDGG
jgi:hypothetical protein